MMTYLYFVMYFILNTNFIKADNFTDTRDNYLQQLDEMRRIEVNLITTVELGLRLAEDSYNETIEQNNATCVSSRQNVQDYLPGIQNDTLKKSIANGYPRDTTTCIVNAAFIVYNSMVNVCEDLLEFMLSTARKLNYDLPLRRSVYNSLPDRVSNNYMQHFLEFQGCTDVDCLDKIMENVRWEYNAQYILGADEFDRLPDVGVKFGAEIKEVAGPILSQMDRNLLDAISIMNACCSSCGCVCPYEEY